MWRKSYSMWIAVTPAEAGVQSMESHVDCGFKHAAMTIASAIDMDSLFS